ncbi:MAG: hypothetical protein LBH57_00760, partial [Treponema sp.]|nr:hypothetical protein [Treponema sp.]
NSESYASDDVFTKNIVPLVESLMTERRDFWRGVPPDEGMAKLKAFGIALEDNTGPQFKNNFLSLLGSTEYRGKPMEAAQFLIKNVLPENREALNVCLSERGFRGPEETKKILRRWMREDGLEKRTEKEPASIGR